MRSLLFSLALAALAASLGGSASAQRPIEWEPLPGLRPFVPNGARVVGFVPGEGGGFRVVAGIEGDLAEWDEATQTWELLCVPTHCIADAIAIRDSVVMTGSLAGPGAGGALSLDGGRTWAFDVFDAPTGDNIAALLWSAHPDTDGSLLVGQSFRLFRSDDLGREGTYVELGLTGGQVEAIAEVPPSAALPGGRVLAGVWNGLSLSDDGGRTFRSSNVYRQGGLIGTSIAVHPDPAHPYGAVAYAAVTLAGEDPPVTALFRSDDGGATWAETARMASGG
ncbi:MAG TPA: hypothetical protein EYG39_03430 [Rhodothermales bacterium]|nr:hypothetical protein [Rhodothermales bacterium]